MSNAKICIIEKMKLLFLKPQTSLNYLQIMLNFICKDLDFAIICC